ncbi:hypothetical protein QO000_000888 [Alkalihalobacillus hemicentroti]|uniref:Uncharacterized protein n=1 Tax=Guptibacillus hwajinpoensis TaxID=208199 RepID=A0ABU0JXX2_9BACL|nr:hypothetical protein [Alkalihalobacillus hemicentroti]
MLTARRAESEHPGAEINHLSKSNNAYQKSHRKKNKRFSLLFFFIAKLLQFVQLLQYPEQIQAFLRYF